MRCNADAIGCVSNPLAAGFLIAINANFGHIHRMRKVTFTSLFLFCASTCLGQSVSVSPSTLSSDAARAEFINVKYWSRIGEYKDETKGFTLFSRNLFPNPDGQIEFWVKIVPNNTVEFNKRYALAGNSAFVIQYATVDCSKRFLSLERTGVYDSANARLGNGSSELTPKASRDRVKQGSIGSEIYASVCVRLE